MARQQQLELLNHLGRLLNHATRFTRRIEYGRVTGVFHNDVFDQINAQLDVIESVRQLCLSGRYRTGLICIRSVLEHYFAIRLAAEARRFALLLRRKSGESRMKMLERVKDELVSTPQAHDGKALRVAQFGVKDYLVFDGLFLNGVRKAENRISYYYLVQQQYDPDKAYLSTQLLKSKWPWDTLLERRRLPEDKKHHKDLHKVFMSYESLIFHSRVNRFLTVRQAERVAVHYNFLSQFVHPTKASGEALRVDNTIRPFIKSVWDVRLYDFHVCHLVLLYLAFLTAMFLEMQMRIVLRAPRVYFTGLKSHAAMEECCATLYENYGYFWFIYHGRPPDIEKFRQLEPRLYGGNLPTPSAVRDLADAKVRYYSNPLSYLYSLSEAWENRILGRVKGPLVGHPKPWGR